MVVSIIIKPISDILYIPYRILILIWTTIMPLPSSSSTIGGSGKGTVRIKPFKPAILSIKTTDKDQEISVNINKWIDDNIVSLNKGFKPSWWLPNGHLQTFFTVIGDFTKVDPVHYTRTYLRLPDNGTIGLDTSPLNHDELPEDAPTIVVSHGLTGGSHESYVRNILAWVTKPIEEGGMGARGVVVNFRGCAGVPVTSCQLYSAGTTMDLSIALHHIRNRYPKSPLIGIGFSLGASIMSRYLGESSDKSLLLSAIILGCPWDLQAGSDQLEKRWFTSYVYSSALAQNILRMFFNAYKNNPESFDKNEEMREVIPELLKLKKRGKKARLIDVDHLLVAKIGGPKNIGAWPFDRAEGYYKWASPKNLLGNVKVPLLALNAFDDPVVATTSLPLEELQTSSHVYVGVTSSGGHLGWFDGPIRGPLSKRRWVLKPVMEFFKASTRDLPLSQSVDFLEKEGDGDGWEWVKEVHDVPGVEKVGWKVLKEGEVVQGEEGSGVMQGL